MLKNYFKLAWRHILKNFQVSFLNLIGLSTGLACTILIYLWVTDELTIDKFNKNDPYIYQVLQPVADGNGALENTPGLLADALQKEMPEIEYAAAVISPTWFSTKGLFSFDNTHIRADAQFVSKEYFNIFSCEFIAGDAGQLFAGKHNVIISVELAISLFGTTHNILGKVLEWNQENFSGSYVVAGLFKKFPSNSTIRFDAAFNYDLFLEKNTKLLKWTNNDPSTYILLKQGTDIQTLNTKLASFIKTKNAESTKTLFAQRFSDKYLHNHYENGMPTGGRIEYVKLFSIIAIFILIIACINFMNLSTAKSIKRGKEVGIQKVIGATRRSLVIQYMSESLLMVFLSLLLALLLVASLLPSFREITGKNISLRFTIEFMLPLVIIAILTGLVAGSYPSLYLSRFRPVAILKGRLKNSVSEVLVRKGLVVFQFAISVLLVISVIIVYQQMKLIKTANLGYKREHVIYFDKGGKLPGDNQGSKEAVVRELETLIEQIKTIPGVINASNFRHSIVNRQGGTTDVKWEGKSPNDQTAFTDIACGYNFIETLGIEIKQGRSYSKAFGSDFDKVVFNEAAIKEMGLTNPIGKTVTIWGTDKQIVGVTKDFHFQSLYENIKPCFFDLSVNHRVSKIIVKIKAGTDKATIDKISKVYKEYTGETLDYKFLDEDYQALYASEQRVEALSRYFAGFAILISCLGVFGLAAFTAQKRQKEIGIRKVVGASVTNIVAMLSKDFLVLVSISFMVALPLAWWFANQWLQNFAYRVTLSPFVFLFTILFVLGITLLTVSFQSIKAAITSPVKSLGTE